MGLQNGDESDGTVYEECDDSEEEDVVCEKRVEWKEDTMTAMTPTQTRSDDVEMVQVKVFKPDERLGIRIREEKVGRVTVSQVDEGGPACSAGVLRGDRLFSVNGSMVSGMQYRQVLKMLKEERPVTLQFVRTSFQNDDDYEIVDRSELMRNNTVQTRESIFQQALELGDLKRVRALAHGGIPEKQREIYWKVLLGYLPLKDIASWEDVRTQHLELYRAYKKEFLVFGGESEMRRRPSWLQGQGWWEAGVEKWKLAAASDSNEADQIAQSQDNAGTQGENQDESKTGLVWQVATDDPLSKDFSASKAVEENPDRELREEIWKDAQRTHPGYAFFSETGCEIMERILFIYAKLNPGVRYVQGMCEILAPIMFVFRASSEQSEADSFFCFCNLMAEIRDMYIKGLDSSQDGLRGKMNELMNILERHDQPLADHLETLEISPQFFALRWLTTLLSREFDLSETIRLWDTLFADPNRFRFVLYVCCAMLHSQRETLLRSDFASCVKLLQDYPSTEGSALEDLLRLADRIHSADVKPTDAAVDSASWRAKITLQRLIKPTRTTNASTDVKPRQAVGESLSSSKSVTNTSQLLNNAANYLKSKLN